MAKQGSVVTARAVRRAKTLMDLAVDLSKPVADVPRLELTPHFKLHVQPRPDGPGWLSMRAIERDTSPDFELLPERTGKAKITLASLPDDPLAEFRPKAALGASFVVGSFHATEKNGWGRIIATFDPPKAKRPNGVARA